MHSAFPFKHSDMREWAECAANVPEYVDIATFEDDGTYNFVMRLVFQGTSETTAKLHGGGPYSLTLLAIGRESSAPQSGILKIWIDQPSRQLKAEFTLNPTN